MTGAMRALLLLQFASLAGIGWLALRPPPKAGAPADPAAPDLSAAPASRGAALLSADRYPAAALAFERAAAVAAPSKALALLDRARHARALEYAARPELPARSEVPRMTALADALEAAGDPVAPLLRVVVLRTTGRLTKASTLAEALVSEQPWARWHLGALRLQQARVADAIEHLEALAKAHPAFGAGKHRLGLAYSAAQRDEAAIQALQDAVTAGAGHAAELDLGRLFLRKEMWAEALPHLENSLRARPADAEVVRLIAAAHFHLKRYARAAQTYQRAYEMEPAPRTLLSAAIAWQADGKPAVALELLDRLAPRVAAIPEILFQRALALSALKRPVAPTLKRYLEIAQGVASEARRVEQAKAFLKGPPGTPPPAPPALAPPTPGPAAGPR